VSRGARRKRVAARVEHCADSRERGSDFWRRRDVYDVASKRESEANSEACAVNGGKGRCGERTIRLISGLKVVSIIASASSSPGCASAEVAARAECRALTANHHRANAMRAARSRHPLSSATIASFNACHLVGRLRTISARPFSTDKSTLILVASEFAKIPG